MEQEGNTFYVPALLPIPIKILSQWLKHGLDSEVDLLNKHKLFYNDIQARRETRPTTPQRDVCTFSSSSAWGGQSHAQMLLPCEEGNWPPGCSASLWDKKLTVWMSSLNNVLVNWSFSRWDWISALWNVFRGEFRFPLRTQTLSDLLFTPSLWLGCIFLLLSLLFVLFSDEVSRKFENHETT